MQKHCSSGKSAQTLLLFKKYRRIKEKPKCLSKPKTNQPEGALADFY